MTAAFPTSQEILAAVWSALGGPATALERVQFLSGGDLASVFAVTDLAAGAVGAAGLAAAEFSAGDAPLPALAVDRRLSAMWFSMAARVEGWAVPSAWDAIAGDYQGADGWIRLHTNAPHHRVKAVQVLGCADERPAVAAAVAKWRIEALEEAIVAAGGCAAAMRTEESWTVHPQGAAVGAEPLIHRESHPGSGHKRIADPGRPLKNIRILDLTRVLAGPIATRFLAGLGADVLRIDPPFWDEPTLEPEVTRGKRCARLDLRVPDQKAQLISLLRTADVIVHGYRPGALEGFGLGAQARREINPALIDVSLDAYGWSGPWAWRRGFDSLVQMSSGIAAAGMRQMARDKPTPLPMQALDHAQGYMLAASVLRGLTNRAQTGGGWSSRSSLARVAALLMTHPADHERPGIAAETPDDLAEGTDLTEWGMARWLKPPVTIAGVPLLWDRPSSRLGSAAAVWA